MTIHYDSYEDYVFDNRSTLLECPTCPWDKPNMVPNGTVCEDCEQEKVITYDDLISDQDDYIAMRYGVSDDE